MPGAEGAIERLYEDADVRDELRDDEANTLLKWAEDRLTQLAAQAATDEEFDAKASQFRSLLKGMNRLVGNRSTLDADALNTRLAELSAQAASVASAGQASAQAAPSIPADQLKDVAGKLPSLDDAAAVNTLTALFTPGIAPAQTVSSAVSAPAEVPAPPSDMPSPAADVPVPARSDVSAPTPVPEASAPVQDVPAENEGGLLHEFAIHFWHPRKKTPPQ
jgi:hypothetical protein